MPAQPLPRFLETHETRRAHAQKLARVVQENDIDLRERPTRHTAADSRTLRGIPAIGRGVAGAIPGTSPDRVVASPRRASIDPPRPTKL